MSETSSQGVAPSLYITEDIVVALTKAIELHSVYFSNHINILNKFIGHLRKVSTLRFERTTLIKFVKKLRFFNDSLLKFDISSYLVEEDLSALLIPLGSFFIKCLETFDLLNYYFTQSLQKEIIAKTLNTNLNLSTDTIIIMDDTYNHFIKFSQWLIESLELESPLLNMEIIEFSRKCAIEDGTQQEETDNIFLQEVVPVDDEEEFESLANQWTQILEQKLEILQEEFEETASNWHENFGKFKNQT
ncbi:hypothetical protein NCAS_0A04300 [Naumovozyma castellii]|uniref:RNA binding protein She2 domain-containing protein n=1 Tax=Naumovozyma castellii TaxID=27288 RepID=G0V696_NAUCA|nr:hypothetical protein NCAS_0A04300 [Naumovozyma castellii CBS 4309]CCC66988.1 hypothetical protein NCAS_0A04300 [Naumovozyma castellii CBS 4309]